jgi:hypothetical protein
MKSPWKFLLDLTSRGRAVEPRESISEPVSESSDATLAGTDPPAVTQTTDAVTNAAAPEPSEVENNVRADRTNAVHFETASHSTNLVAEQAPEQADRPTRKSLGRQTRDKRSSASVAVDPRVEYGSPSMHAPKRPISIEDDVSALDKDIRMLRRQLAEKLELQNAQLKKMLERF